MKVVVLGGGFIGQLVQLAIPSARVLERRQKPTSHLDTRFGPQYLWAPIPGCESRSFPVITTVDGVAPTPESILAYKQKIGKENDGGDWEKQFQHEMVGWESQLPEPRIDYEMDIAMIDLEAKRIVLTSWVNVEYDILISTIPLDRFLSLLIYGPVVRYPWRQDPIWFETYDADPVEGMKLDYISTPKTPTYRSTLFGSKLFLESLEEVPSARKVVPGKIHPHPEIVLVTAGLATFDVVTFGRFGSWQPDELAHETWDLIVAWKRMMGL